MVSPGDLNQRSFPGLSVSSVTALRCFRQALGRLQLINTALVAFSINRINRLIGQSWHVIITFAINAVSLLIIIMFVIIHPVKP